MSLVYCPCGHVEDNDQHACPVTQERLRKRLSGALQHLEEAREGLANATQEVQQLRALLSQAPIAKLTVRESGAGHYAPDEVSVSLYAPGLPPGEHDVYLMPEVPSSGHPGVKPE